MAHISLGRRRVRAYGEMVALLWAEGNVNGAIQLEKLWNDMGKIRDFSLFCAYPQAAVAGYANSAPLAEVYTEHSHAVSE
jgi:hypothetical protein